MDPKDYTGREWTQLAKEMTPRQLRNSLKRSYRAEANKALAIAREHLHRSGLRVLGNRADWDKGIRRYIYSRGGGFLITVKAHRASMKQMAAGNPGAGMHKNRRGWYKPVLMWAEDGTQPRTQRNKRKDYSLEASRNKAGLKKSGSKHYVRTTGLSTGQMGAYEFLKKATPEMYQEVEEGLGTEVGIAVQAVAKKCGFI